MPAEGLQGPTVILCACLSETELPNASVPVMN